MPTIYLGGGGSITKYAVGTWSDIRDATSGNTPVTTRTVNAMYAFHTPGRGSNVYNVTRSFYYFDTSGITGTVDAARLRIHGYWSDSADVIVVKSDAFGGDGGTALASADFNNFDTSTPYSSELTSWTASDWNQFELNSTAKTDIQNDNYLIVCVMEHDHDFQDSAISNSGAGSGAYHDYTSTTYDVHLVVSLVATGYGHVVNGVAAASIGKVKGVATANIEKIIGV